MTPLLLRTGTNVPYCCAPLLEPHLRAIGTSLLRAQCAAWNCAPFARTVPFWRRSTVLRRHSRAAQTGGRAWKSVSSLPLSRKRQKTMGVGGGKQGKRSRAAAGGGG
jgi:hypothetical protein